MSEKKKRITVQSAKAKARRLQQSAVAMVYRLFPELEPGDCTSCPMGSSGADVILSPAAKIAFPFSVECKAKANGFSPVYAALEQADRGDGLTPIAFIKQDRCRPIVALYADDFERLIATKIGARL